MNEVIRPAYEIAVMRDASIADLPFVFRLERAYIEELEPQMLERWSRVIDVHLQQWIGNLSRMFVAEVSGRAIGYCCWEVDGEQAVLASIHIIPEFRRHGAGRKLLEKFESDASAQNCKLFTLSVIKHNPARHLYAAAAYAYVMQDGDYQYYRKSALAGQGTAVKPALSSLP